MTSLKVRWSLALAAVVALFCIPLRAAAERHPNKESTYTITSVLQLVDPVNPDDMNDDFQDVRVLSHEAGVWTVEVTYYPFRDVPIEGNPSWRAQDAAMTEYLNPTPTENWDPAMRKDLLAELISAGIDPDALTDKELVEQVSRWALKRAHSTGAFGVWCVYYPDGKPSVYPQLRAAFEKEKPKDGATDEWMFGQENLGRQMFYNKVHGSCTSSSVYMATIMRALGIPTRIVFCVPPFDPNDTAQADLFYSQIHDNRVRETVRAALNGSSGFANHLFNEVYVGHRWVRLNYSTLGQPILDKHYFGLLTHIYTCADLSTVPLAQTWGMRYFEQDSSNQPALSSTNPYKLVSVTDHFGANADIPNPPVPVAEVRTCTIVGLLRPGASGIPSFAAKSLAPRPGGADFLISCKEWVSGSYLQMRAFKKRAGQEFLLVAPDHPTLRARLTGGSVSTGDGSFQGYLARIVQDDRDKIAPDAVYSIEPQNTSEVYHWEVASPDVRLAWTPEPAEN